MKKIIFKPLTEQISITEKEPMAAYNFIPLWFKKIQLKRKDIDNTKYQNKYLYTIKKCTPIIDGLTSGYIISTPQDIEVVNNENNKILSWKMRREKHELVGDLISTDDNFRINGMKIPEEYDETIWRIDIGYSVKTPKGYSILITQPLNRFDSPFLVFSAVLDSDHEFTRITIPFFIKKSFTGTIDIDTPIVQIIPFKRDNWIKILEKPFKDTELYGLVFNRNKTNGAYRKFSWRKKVYL